MGELNLVVGTYAKIVKEPVEPADVTMYKWSCIVFPARSPQGDLSSVVEKVEFTLHKSFPNVCRSIESVFNMTS